jgi:hypothetical protein
MLMFDGYFHFGRFCSRIGTKTVPREQVTSLTSENSSQGCSVISLHAPHYLTWR